MAKLSTRQAGLMLFIIMLCNKMLSLNSHLAYDVLSDAWLVYIISFVIDFLFVLICIYFMRVIDKPFLEYTKEKFGKPVSIVIAILISVLFVFRTTQIMVDVYLFFAQLIYAEISRLIFIVCFISILFYFGSRQFRSLGRSAEMLIVLIFISLFLSFLMSIKVLDLEKILPVLSTKFSSICKSSVKHNLWFGDFLIFFFFIGNVKMEKNTAKKLIFSYLSSCFIVILFAIVFICAFGNTASMHRVAVIDITEFSPRLVAQGRFNWLVCFLFPIALILGLGINANCLTMCFKFCVGQRRDPKNVYSGIIATATILAVCIIFRFAYSAFYDFVTTYFFYYTFFAQYVLAVVMLSIVNIKKLRENKQKTTKKLPKNAKFEVKV